MPGRRQALEEGQHNNIFIVVVCKFDLVQTTGSVWMTHEEVNKLTNQMLPLVYEWRMCLLSLLDVFYDCVALASYLNFLKGYA